MRLLRPNDACASSCAVGGRCTAGDSRSASREAIEKVAAVIAETPRPRAERPAPVPASRRPRQPHRGLRLESPASDTNGGRPVEPPRTTRPELRRWRRRKHTTAAQVRDRMVRTRPKLNSSARRLNAGQRTDYDSARVLSQPSCGEGKICVAESR